MQTEKVVMFDSDEAASFKTGIEGWVSRDGHFYGKDERIARYAGCTHRKCESCPRIIEKGRVYCLSCEETRRAEKWDKLAVEKWNGSDFLVEFDTEHYFFQDSAVMDHVYEEHAAGREIRLCKCEPQYLGYISDDNWCDDLPEDGELPAEVYAAMEALNAAIKDAGPVAWREGSIAIDSDDLIARLTTA